MKSSSLRLVALSAVFAVAGFAVAQPLSTGTPPAETAKPTRLVKVATINGAQANREFQANVQLLQAQRQAAIELSGKIEKEKDAKKKKELQTQLDQIMTKLNENNAAMQKAYGFTLTRNYVMEIEAANIYVQVTEEEAAKIEQAEKDAQKAKDTKKK